MRNKGTRGYSLGNMTYTCDVMLANVHLWECFRDSFGSDKKSSSDLVPYAYTGQFNEKDCTKRRTCSCFPLSHYPDLFTLSKVIFSSLETELA